MITHICEAAENQAIAVTSAGRGMLHAKCPGGYRHPDGSAHRCDCSCHREQWVDLTVEAVLPVMEPEAAEPPPATTQDRKKPTKGPPTGRCEHCGEPCRGRFVVGHDAKLKSELSAAARLNRPADWMELMIRGWDQLISAKKRPHPTVVAQAEDRYRSMTEQERADWIVARNAMRRQHRYA